MMATWPSSRPTTAGAPPIGWADPDAPGGRGIGCFGLALSPDRPRQPGSPLERFRRLAGRSGAPAGDGSLAASSTQRPLASGSSAGPLPRWLGTVRRAEHEPDWGGLLPGPAGLHGTQGAGRTSRRRQLGRSVPASESPIAPAFVARRMRRSVGLPDRDGLLVRGVEDDSSAGPGPRDHPRGPDRRGGRQSCRRRRRPLHGARSGDAARTTWSSCAGPRNGP